MFPCQVCATECTTVLAYVRHTRIHKNIPNSVFKCVVPDCKKTFQSFAAFKSHAYRHHKVNKPVVRPRLCGATDLTCHVDFCSVTCENLTSFFSHLRIHIKEGKIVSCPFRQCEKQFRVLSTFTSHMSRKHRNSSEDGLVNSVVRASVEKPSTSHDSNERDEQSHMDHSASSDVSGEQSDVCPENADAAQFLENLALFYLKLRAKLLLPSSVIQVILEDFQEIHDISQSHLLFKLKEKLVALGVPDADISTVIDVLKTEDLLRACNTETLKTDQRRKNVFKNTFNYVEPVPICLGQNEAGKECFAQYVPIKQTIESLFQYESVREQYSQVHSRVPSEDVLRDVWDGSNIREHLLFKTEVSSLGLILYQDSFEVVNPLGSGKKKTQDSHCVSHSCRHFATEQVKH